MAIYPAGLMCEDGLSTPVPKATYKFLKWMNVDVYMARTEGTYFVMPKWSKKLRPGRTTLDISLLFTKEELATLSIEEIQKRTDAVLLYDAYREQEKSLYSYKNCSDVRGLENVLYMCPVCGQEHVIVSEGKSTLLCTVCGYSQEMDEHGFFHCEDKEKEIRYASDWSKLIYRDMEKRLEADHSMQMQAAVSFFIVDDDQHKMVEAGKGTILLKRGSIILDGKFHGEKKAGGADPQHSRPSLLTRQVSGGPARGGHLPLCIPGRQAGYEIYQYAQMSAYIGAGGNCKSEIIRNEVPAAPRFLCKKSAPGQWQGTLS